MSTHALHESIHVHRPRFPSPPFPLSSIAGRAGDPPPWTAAALLLPYRRQVRRISPPGLHCKGSAPPPAGR